MSIKHIIISGRVQGVGFRQYVFREAVRRQLRGWVRNLNDGRVEILVDLPELDDVDFLQFLKKGPLFSKVTHLELIPFNGSIDLEAFNVQRDGSAPYV